MNSNMWEINSIGINDDSAFETDDDNLSEASANGYSDTDTANLSEIDNSAIMQAQNSMLSALHRHMFDQLNKHSCVIEIINKIPEFKFPHHRELIEELIKMKKCKLARELGHIITPMKQKFATQREQQFIKAKKHICGNFAGHYKKSFR